jgi:hypothetical protein
MVADSASPVVYDSLQDIQHWQQRSLTILKQAAERGLRHDATETLVPTFFFSAYTGDDPRELLDFL